MSTKKPTQAERRAARIDRERKALALKPWEVSPSQIGWQQPCHYGPSYVIRESWERALAMQLELGRDYFKK
jgi:hypothetical protein